VTPSNPLWRDFPTLNRYAARIQSFLQRGRSDNDILFYYPIYDRFATTGESLLQHFDGTLQPFEGTAFAAGAELMQSEGFAFDFISDRQLQDVTFDSGYLHSAGANYQTVVIPECRYMPLETLAHAVALAEEGATIVFYRGVPHSVPGLGNLAKRSVAFKRLVDRIEFAPSTEDGVQEARLGKGRMLIGDDLDHVLKYAEIRREPLVEDALAFIRRQDADGGVYFLVNPTDSSIAGWIPLATPFRSVGIFNPMSGHTGLANVRTDDHGIRQVFVQTRPGESLLLRTYDTELAGPPYRYYRKIGPPHHLGDTWKIRFIAGGPTLPDEIHSDTLRSWTEFTDAALRAFSGTASYTHTFSAPDEATADAYELDLGDVRESAVVYLNGQELGTLIGPTYQLIIPQDAMRMRSDNRLEIRVSNRMANRIADLDRRGVPWKKFYNINFPAWLPENRNERNLFDASAWDPQASGLLGPVALTPVDMISTTDEAVEGDR
jgi:hypothetical protein